MEITEEHYKADLKEATRVGEAFGRMEGLRKMRRLLAIVAQSAGGELRIKDSLVEQFDDKLVIEQFHDPGEREYVVRVRRPR